MDLIPIPVEGAIERQNKNKKTISRFRQKILSKKLNFEKKFLKKTVIEMVRFVDNGKKMSKSDMDDLIKNLQKSQIYIQNQKNKLLEKKNKKSRNK